MNINTTIQLNRQSLEGLYNLIDWLLKTYPASDKSEQLLDEVIERVRKKLRSKVEAYSPRNSYSVTLKKEEALAYFLWMEQLLQSIPFGMFVYELSVSAKLTDQIDRNYGTINAARSNAIALPTTN